MKIGFILNEDETVNNFSLAEAVYTECKRHHGLDAEAVAKMILSQIDAEKGGAE